MGKTVMNKEYMLNNREEILARYDGAHTKSSRPKILTKKERKTLGVGKDQGVAIARNVRINAMKVQAVLNLIRGKELDEAYAILQYTPRGASPVLTKLLKSAESNAVNNNELDRDSLYIAECYADQGPTLKRIRARARGSATRINKRTSHITIVVKEKQ
ncbi:MAG: 50S ribosomal protein L22 [Fastidiosipilaceae bacterium]